MIKEAWVDQARWLRRAARRGLSSTIGHNILSLYGLQFANYILPLITVPYLVRVLGPEKFGAVAFAQGLIAYFALLVNYGFDWSATRTISVQRDDVQAVSKTASNVWAAKALLAVVGLLVLAPLARVVPRLREASVLLFVLYGTVLGNVLFPTWLFQGLERMVAISAINLAVRLLTTIGIFAFIKQPADFLDYAVLLSIQGMGAGLLAVFVARRNLGVRFALPSLKEIYAALKEGWTLFLSTGAVSLYTAGNAFILGLFTNNTIVGYYSAAEKLVRAAQGLLGPVAQATYPRFSRMAMESREQALRWGARVLCLMGGLGLGIALSLLFGAPLIVRIMLGEGYSASVSVLRILAAIPFLVGINNVLGVQIMLAFHRDQAVVALTLGAGLLSLLLALVLVPTWSMCGMAAAVVAAELFVTGSFAVYCHTQGLSPLLVANGSRP